MALQPPGATILPDLDNPFAASSGAPSDLPLEPATSMLVRRIRFWMAAAGGAGVLSGLLLAALVIALFVAEGGLVGADPAERIGEATVYLCGFVAALTFGGPGLLALGSVRVGGQLAEPDQVRRSLAVQLWVWRLLVLGALLVLAIVPGVAMALAVIWGALEALR